MATSSIHFFEELTQQLRRMVMQRFRELLFENGTLIPTTTDLQPGVERVTEDILQGLGDATLLAPGANDIPLVQISITRDDYPVVMAVSAYSMEWREERALNYSGKREMVNKARMDYARRAIAEALNRFAAYGDVGIGARGLYNNANLTIDSNSFNPNTATFTEFVTFLIDVVLRLGVDSDQVSYTTDVLLPPLLHARAQLVTDAQNTAISVLQAVRNRLRDEQNISSVRFLAVPESSSARLERRGVLAPGTNKDRIIAYNRDPRAVSRQIEQSIAEFLPPEYMRVEGTTKMFPMFSCATATKVSEIQSIRAIDVTKTTALV